MSTEVGMVGSLVSHQPGDVAEIAQNAEPLTLFGGPEGGEPS